MRSFTKVVRLGKTAIGDRLCNVFCKIELKEGNLSITGVEGPYSNGDAAGSCGQIDMSRPEIDPLAPGWTKEKLSTFWDIWREWHLNDMRPGCEHQVGPEWQADKKITLYHFRTKKHVREAVKSFKYRALAALIAGETVTPLAEETRLAQLKDEITVATPELPASLAADYEPNGPQYEGDHYNRASEEKTAGWVHPEEHPDGILTKPCPVCGYKYGSKWKRKELPAEVVKFLEALPDTDIQPAWV